MSEPKVPVCETCKAFMLELLDARIRKILEVGREDEDADYGQSHCFHLMELKSILRGEVTCGVFDDYSGPPKPRTITGPLFWNAPDEKGDSNV